MHYFLSWVLCVLTFSPLSLMVDCICTKNYINYHLVFPSCNLKDEFCSHNFSNFIELVSTFLIVSGGESSPSKKVLCP